MKSDYLEFETLCNKIINASSKIQSVAVINKLGRPVERVSRNKNSEFSTKTSEMLFMQCVLQVSMGRDFDEHYGPINYYISERANATMLTFPVEDHVVFLTTSRNASPISLARKVAGIISDSAKKNPPNLEGNKILVNA